MDCYNCNTSITGAFTKVTACPDEGGMWHLEACSHTCALQLSALFHTHEVHIEEGA